MPLTPVAHPGFSGGLNLRDQPDVVDASQAVDLLNVTFTDRGAVRQRDGYAAFTAGAGANRYDSLAPFYTSAGTRQLVAGAGNRLEALDTAGAVVASTTSPTASPHYFARFGGPAAEVMYVSNGTDQLRQWNGTAWSTPAWTGNSPTGRFVAVTPWDNRLVNARKTGTTAAANPSTVLFSDVAETGAPLNWPANNYVQVTPGDGEPITGLAVWRDYLFVFKESKFFVFYGTATAADGTPEFQYRPVEAGVGLVAPGAVCVGPEGVYFLDRRGVFRTSGGQPEAVSDLVAPLFSGETSDFYLGGALNQAQLSACRMCWHDEQVYLSFPVGSDSACSRVLVFDPAYKWWSLWGLPAAALASFRGGDQPKLVFAASSGANHVMRMDSQYSTDAGASISSRWMSGWFDFGDTGIKSVRELKVWGKGKAVIGTAQDYRVSGVGKVVDFAQGTDVWGTGSDGQTWGSGSPQTWGSGQALTPQLVRGVARRGTTFALTVTSTNGERWMVLRVAAHLRSRRTPSMVRVDT